jgi:predicted DNA-binding transcriptional regulator YafY
MGRLPKRYSQAERLTRTIRALASRDCTINDLAHEFAVTRRQVYRDLARIEEEGHPLVQSDGAGERAWRRLQTRFITLALLWCHQAT